MRRLAPLVLLLLLPARPTAWAEDSVPGSASPHNIEKRPAIVAEPEVPGAYASPEVHKDLGPSDADRGPAQKHFVLAWQTDDLMQTQVADNASLINHEKIALDRRISTDVIHDVQDDAGANSSSAGSENHALQYELQYLNWGAITQEQVRARQGHYFTITWENAGPPSDFTARFEYRQVRSKEIVRVLKQPMHRVDGTVRSYFAVIDKAYLAYGPVYSWRFTILKGDTIVAQEKSFVW